MYQRTQRDLASTINQIIDNYWEDKINENQMTELIHQLHKTNSDKFMKNGKYTTIILQQCGKRRLNIVTNILSEIDSIEDKNIL
ncbi:TIGR04540 family protein [Aquibacillus kalidii]|uniref:TIGR04540 family protein n=1 Tax=Aquibacillus kalidii TaxID=2762597 RepID=UPI001C9A033F|nr:TIGR04540 family protein [Aquibacillus kalidii]